MHFFIFLFRQRNITIYSLVGSPCIIFVGSIQMFYFQLITLETTIRLYWQDYRLNVSSRLLKPQPQPQEPQPISFSTNKSKMGVLAHQQMLKKYILEVLSQ